METPNNPGNPVIAARHKAVLKHTQSNSDKSRAGRWREVRCGHADAERLDCVRFIAAFHAPVR